ncbi:DNA-binding protein [Eikenella corrodens]|uniref:DNA-binding protein n=1 Tax=Eikenella corrodens TaxID=539 RepID=UPI0014310868
MQLPNLPRTRQAVAYRAKREGWHVTVKKGIGAGGRLNVYALNDLPKDLRTAIQAKTASDLLEKAKASKPIQRPSQAGLPLDTVIKGYNQKQIACAHARMSLVAEVLHIHRTSGIPVHKAVALMVEQIELGALNEAMMKLVPIANNKSGGASKIGQRSLAGWVAAYKKAGSPNERLVALAPGKGKQELPIEAHIWLGDFLAIHCRPQNPPLAHSYQDFAEWYGKQPAPAYTLPSYDAVKRVWNKLPEIMRQRGRKTGPAYTKILPHEKRDWDVLEPNDVWIGDGHSFKAKVQHPVHGSPFKPEVTVVLDGCTRMVMGFSVSFAESCIAVCDALRIGMKHFGLPLI